MNTNQETKLDTVFLLIILKKNNSNTINSYKIIILEILTELLISILFFIKTIINKNK